ncbi:DNA polymerase III subunit beta [Candidatus Nomurabacteria bacterium]|nr:DNA polymerase III subunit beta [Candidatus Nomurabacteria bacterium]
MDIECTVEKIKNAVLLAERMTGKNLSLPILHSLFLSTTGKSIRIRSTNLAVGVDIEIPAQVKKEGEVSINGATLSNVFGNLEDDTVVVLRQEGEHLLLQTEHTKTIINTFPLEEFPTLPVVEGESFTIEAATFAEGIRSVYFCAATTEIKPEIASIFIYAEQQTLFFVATDSFRLAEKKIKIKGLSDISKILIPYKNSADLLRVLDSLSGEVVIMFNKNQLSLFGGGIYFTTRLIDGAFPDYRLILPKEEETKVVLIKQELLSTLRLSNVFSDKFSHVLFSVSPTIKKVLLSARNTDVGSNESSVDAVIEGEAIEVSFNLKYFIDVFQALQGDSVALLFTKVNKPILVKSVQDTSFLYLLVPTNR